jgi:hypothetical protein
LHLGEIDHGWFTPEFGPEKAGATAPFIVIPAKAGTHFSGGSAADEWVPAFAGMTIFIKEAG